MSSPLLPPSGPQRIVLVRHAQSEWNAAHRWQGQADPPLSDVGRHQATTLADHPRLARADVVVSSDLRRAHDTAAAIVVRTQVPVTTEPLLRELDVGSWSGLTRTQIEAQQPGAIARYRAGIAGWEGGESFEAHAERSRAAAVLLAAWPDASTLVAVTHGGTIRMLVATFLELGLEGRAGFSGAGHATVTELVRAEHGWMLAAYGA